ncbi:Hypothetical_protein [Hexamita inflata]|uniref:Hypothetical_protein n=1 Tax=Hexamita inflata TaxID=28002 RepID=A0ABP1JZT1_9EUKA
MRYAIYCNNIRLHELLFLLQQENVKTLLEGSDVLYQNKTKMSPIFKCKLLFPLLKSFQLTGQICYNQEKTLKRYTVDSLFQRPGVQVLSAGCIFCIRFSVYCLGYKSRCSKFSVCRVQ